MSRADRQAFRIAAIYVVFSICWIIFSDQLLSMLVQDAAEFSRLQTWKGLVFVSATALLIFALIRRVLAARALVEQDLHQINRIINRSPVVTIAWDNAPGWPLRFVNATVNQWGYSPEQLRSGQIHFADLIHPDDMQRVSEEVAHHLAQGPDDYTQEYRIRSAAGQWIWLNDRTWLERDKQGQVRGIYGVLQDISAAREAMTRLEESENRLRTLLETIPDLVWMKNPEGVYLICNRVFERLFGATQARIVGNTDYDFVPPELADSFREHDRKAMAADQSCINEEWLTFAADGYRGLFETIKTPVRDGQGRLLGVLGVAREVTQAREAQEELRLLNINLEYRVAERTAELEALNRELESFSYSVSHDLKAPLRGIDGYSQLLQEDYGQQLPEDGRLFLENIRKGVAQMHQLIEDLLAYSRMERRPLEATAVDLPRLVHEVVQAETESLTRTGLQVEIQVPPLEARVDRDGLALVLRNLLENAIKFSHAAQPPLIHIEAHQEQGQIQLAVRDHGIGFDMKYHDRIFRIFQRLHRAEDFPGTGIGLALVHKAMQRMGGRVWAESTPGAGATFHLELPS
ncbi:PAS domain S-box protein [Azovibrio restrictus]|uniref:sensor histidine kinase n=1 Tax=Azovibrio restrictus TaxID=146938 RepID=UPI0026EA4971|nr:PAS domain S-box protein [Azovibrio restrictus]MDD3483450.1 PAS domain S-box protein [Azovibrio restrictus]